MSNSRVSLTFSYKSSPLPSPNSQQIQQLLSDLPEVLSAYTVCYDEEQQISREQSSEQQLTEQQASWRNSLVHIRVLGWMFVFATSVQVWNALANAVSSCNKGQYSDLGKYYIDNWIRSFKKIKGRTPTSSHSSRSSPESLVTDIAVLLKSPPTNYSRAKACALARDGHRCVLSGAVDTSSILAFPEIRDMVSSAAADTSTSLKPATAPTQCAHIIANSTNFGLPDEKKLTYAANAWAVLKSFGYDKIPQELNGEGVHRLDNVLTLRPEVHDAFDKLALWFEPLATQDPDIHRYKVGWTEEYGIIAVLHGWPKTVTFVNYSPGSAFAMPSKEYLALHAACCKVAAMSGAGELLDKIDRETESTVVLASDGSSADILANALQCTIFSQRHP